MDETLAQLEIFLSAENLAAIFRGLVLLSLGFVISRIAGRALGRLTAARLEPQHSALLKRAASWGVLLLFATAALHQFGFNLGVLLGAAGVLSVAIGFASQTSASNLISGLFLIAERPFAIGDVITADTTTGEVLSIDLLSVKLRTLDNLFVRIPNETLIKAEVRTLTRFSIRRIDLALSVAYEDDLGEVQRVLFEVADRNPMILDEPKPFLLVKDFADSGVQIQFSPWVDRTKLVDARNAIKREILEAFREAGIEIPFPQRSLRVGRGEPLAVRMVGEDVEPTPGLDA